MLHQLLNMIGTVGWVRDENIVLGIFFGGPDLVAIFFFVVYIRKSKAREVANYRPITEIWVIYCKIRGTLLLGESVLTLTEPRKNRSEVLVGIEGRFTVIIGVDRKRER